MKPQAHHDFEDAIFEVRNGRVSVVLVDATMQRHAGVGMPHQLLHDLISVFLLVHKHQCAALLVVDTQQLQQLEQLLLLLNHDLDKQAFTNDYAMLGQVGTSDYLLSYLLEAYRPVNRTGFD